MLNNSDNANNDDNNTSNLPTSIVDFRGFDSSILLFSRGGVPRPTGNLPESWSQAVLARIMLVGRLCES